jgi:hypothetical protein
MKAKRAFGWFAVLALLLWWSSRPMRADSRMVSGTYSGFTIVGEVSWTKAGFDRANNKWLYNTSAQVNTYTFTNGNASIGLNIGGFTTAAQDKGGSSQQTFSFSSGAVINWNTYWGYLGNGGYTSSGSFVVPSAPPLPKAVNMPLANTTPVTLTYEFLDVGTGQTQYVTVKPGETVMANIGSVSGGNIGITASALGALDAQGNVIAGDTLLTWNLGQVLNSQMTTVTGSSSELAATILPEAGTGVTLPGNLKLTMDTMGNGTVTLSGGLETFNAAQLADTGALTKGSYAQGVNALERALSDGFTRVWQAVKSSGGGGGSSTDMGPTNTKLDAINTALTGGAEQTAVVWGSGNQTLSADAAAVSAVVGMLPAVPNVLPASIGSSGSYTTTLDFGGLVGTKTLTLNLVPYASTLALLRGTFLAIMSLWFFVAVTKTIRGGFAG